MLSRVHILLIVCCLLINVCVSQIHVVIDPDVTEELFKNKKQLENVQGESILAETEPQFYQLVLNGSVLYVGGRESLNAIDLGNWSVSNTVTFATTSSLPTSCVPLDRMPVECYNYVTIIEPRNDCLFVCGTDALSPKCYSVNQMNDKVPHEDSSDTVKTFAPMDPKQESTWLYLEEDDKYFFANGMPSDGSGDSAGFNLGSQSTCNASITKDLIQLKKDGRKWLNVPHFVGDPIELGDFVYFFFREFATEHINAGRVVYSRVARVCKNDPGGYQFSDFKNTFITYQKARLRCSTSTGAGENSNFMYNDIQDVYYDTDTNLVYAVFTTSQPGPTSSAICVYTMSEIVRVFQTSLYWGTNVDTNMWSNPESANVPTPRPGQCGVTYPITDTDFQAFLRNYPLLHDLVQSTLTLVQENVSYVQVVVEKVNNQTLMFIGTDRNSIIKAAINGSEVRLIEEIDLHLEGKPKSPILNIIKDDALECLYISTKYSVYKLPLEACASRDPCDGCTKDPYCIISGTKCVEYQTVPVSPGDTSHCKEKKFKVKGEETNITTAKDKIRNLNFVASARSNLNLSAKDVICDNKCKPVYNKITKSVSGNEEILIVQLSVKVFMGCTCAVTFTANGAEDVRRETNFTLDMSRLVTDVNCLKQVQSYDKKITLYRYELQKWKNEWIQESNCTQSYCNE